MTVSDECITNYVGIDVSKKTLHIYDEQKWANFKIENTILEITKFFHSYDKTTLILYEPTGVYGKNLEFCLNDLKLLHLQVHPNDSHYLIKSLWYKNKNDTIDAKQLAYLAKTLVQQIAMWNKSKFIQPNSNQLNQILAYMSQIRFFKEQIVKCKQQLEVIGNNPYDSVESNKAITNSIKNHNNTIEDITKVIEWIIAQMWLEEKYKNLQTIPGVWPVVALEMVTFFATLVGKWLGKENKKQMVAFSGLNPLENQSWSSINWSSLSRKGNKHIRCMLYLSGIQRSKRNKIPKYYDTTLWKFAQRMKDKFSSAKLKRWKSVWCAMWKKLLELWWAMYRNDSVYKFI